MSLVKKRDKTVSEEELIKQRREKTAQQWIPIADIDGPIVYRKDNNILGMLRVQPQNLNLLSDNEAKRKIEALWEQLNGETEPLQIFCIGRPVDLSNYLEWLQEKARMEQDLTRKMILKGYIQQASEIASSGEITERRFYIIITKKMKPKAEEELLNRLRDLQIKFSQAELSSTVCQDDELMDVLSLFANPIQASFEKNEIQMNISPLLID